MGIITMQNHHLGEYYVSMFFSNHQDWETIVVGMIFDIFGR